MQMKISYKTSVLLMALSFFALNRISSPKFAQESAQMQKNGRNFHSAEYCGQCHTKEYEQWGKSTHSTSNKNPVFQRFLNQFISDTGNKNLRICLRCHIPAAVFNQDIEMKNPDNNAPISCEICHSITGIDSNYELMFDMAGNMFANHSATLGAGHNVIKNASISKTEWCAPCHTAVNPKQKNYICSQDMRFDSWKENTGRPEQCQDCHMRDSFGNMDHSFRGISNPELLKDVLKIRWDVTIEPTNYKVKLIINNDKIAHLFPVGMSMKRVVIEAALANSESKILYKQEAYLGKLYEDRDGIWPVPGWRGIKIRIDNAISPLESRMMVFNLPIVSSADSIILRVYYSRYPDEKDQPLIFRDQKKI
jgi:hypothetical protein